MVKDKNGQGGLRDKLRNLGKGEVQEIGFKEGKIENGQYQDNVWVLDFFFVEWRVLREVILAFRCQTQQQYQ